MNASPDCPRVSLIWNPGLQAQKAKATPAVFGEARSIYPEIPVSLNGWKFGFILRGTEITA